MQEHVGFCIKPEKRSGYSSHGSGDIISHSNSSIMTGNPIFTCPFLSMWNTFSGLAGNGPKCLWIDHGLTFATSHKMFDTSSLFCTLSAPCGMHVAVSPVAPWSGDTVGVFSSLPLMISINCNDLI